MNMMKSRTIILMALGIFPAALAMWVNMAPEVAVPAPTTPPPAVPASVRVHVDPATGRIIPPPWNAKAVAAAAPAGSSTSHAGLVEEPGRTAGGGMIVDLQGRFQSRVVATAGTNGTVVTRCVGGELNH